MAGAGADCSMTLAPANPWNDGANGIVMCVPIVHEVPAADDKVGGVGLESGTIERSPSATGACRAPVRRLGVNP